MIKQFALIIAVAALAACASTPGLPTLLSDFSQVATAVEPLVEDYAADGQINYAQAIPVALNSLAVFDPAAAVDVAQLEPSIASAISAFTNGSAATTGQKIATVIVAALPANPTGAQVNAALTQAGLGANTGSSTVAAASP